MTAKAYLFRTISYGLLVVFAVMGINYAVDPYAITGMPRISGVNEYKVDINDRVRLMKKYSPLTTQHDVLILGNSRVEMGLNPANKCFRKAGMTVYNLGIPGASVRQQLAYGLNVIYQQPIDTVFLSLDFTDFIFTRRHARFDNASLLDVREDGFQYDAAGRKNPSYAWERAVDYFQALFSLDSLVSSVRTLVFQSRTSPDRDDAGFNTARDFAESVRVEGPRALFDQKMNDLRDHFAARWFLRDDAGRLDPAFGDLQLFLDLAVERKLRIFLFVNPFHKIYWDLLTDRDYMSLNEEWLGEVTALVKSYPPGLITLWAFSGDSPYIREVVPSADSRSGPLRWFGEPSHYRMELGDLMIETMLSDVCGSKPAFGRRLH